MSSFRTPGAPSDPGPGGPDPQPGGLRIAGIRIRFTGGALVLAAFAILAASLSLPGYAEGRSGAAYFAAGLAIAILLLFSLALHELAHALVARRRGATIREIVIGFAGGTAHGVADLPGPKAQWRMAAAGPAVSLALAVITGGGAAALAVFGGNQLIMLILASIAVLNTAIGVLGVLPGAGPDGNRIVRALAWARTGDPARAGLTASRAGQVTGVVLVIGGMTLIAIGLVAGLWLAFIGILAFVSSRSEIRQQRFSAVLAGLRVRDVMQPVMPGSEVQSWQTVAAFIEEHGAAAHPGAAIPGAGIPGAVNPGATGLTATAFPLREWNGEAAGLLTLSQLAAVPQDRRETTRLREVATPMTFVVTATPDEQLTAVITRMSAWPRIPAALHTAGHALVLNPDGSPAGILTPADINRAGQFGALRRNSDAAPSGMAGSRS